MPVDAMPIELLSGSLEQLVPANAMPVELILGLILEHFVLLAIGLFVAYKRYKKCKKISQTD